MVSFLEKGKFLVFFLLFSDKLMIGFYFKKNYV